MPMQGKILYDWPNAKIEESLILSALDQLGTEPYDVTIVGAGVVGCAIAYNLSQYQLRVLLVDKRYDVGEGTSKGNSAIIATGFDATPGSLESQLVTQASRKWPELAHKLKIPVVFCLGAVFGRCHPLVNEELLPGHITVNGQYCVIHIKKYNVEFLHFSYLCSNFPNTIRVHARCFKTDLATFLPLR